LVLLLDVLVLQPLLELLRVLRFNLGWAMSRSTCYDISSFS
jgi:hypothetical protein